MVGYHRRTRRPWPGLTRDGLLGGDGPGLSRPGTCCTSVANPMLSSVRTLTIRRTAQRHGSSRQVGGWPTVFMALRDETAKTPREVRGSTNKSSHVCGRRRDGEPAVSWRVEPPEAEAYLKQY